jgi:hypothetical protein
MFRSVLTVMVLCLVVVVCPPAGVQARVPKGHHCDYSHADG